MRHLYNLGIAFLVFGIQLGSWKSVKLRKMVVGRKSLFKQLQDFRNDNKGRLAWFHVASLGEFEQAKPVISELKQQHNGIQVAVSFFSPSGYEQVSKKKQPNVDFVCYLPFDSPQNARNFIDILSPDLAFFVKYDLWANHIQAAKERGTLLFLIAATFRHSQVYFKPYGGFFKKILRLFDHVFTQRPIPGTLIQSLGLRSVSVAGDPRFDNVEAIRKAPKPCSEVASGISKQVLVAGSVWQEDMDRILPFMLDHPEYQYIIAPHDIYSKAIEQWASALPGNIIRYSSFGRQLPNSWDVLIIDTIGMLSSLYQFATIAYVGGAFGKGLHNILEPLAFRIPVIFGWLKQTGKFPEWEISQHSGCGFAIKTAEEFESAMATLKRPETYKQACLAADRLLQENLGSAKKIMEIVNLKMPLQ